MIVGVAVEIHPEERRVALVPAHVPKLVELGLEVLVQKGAGERAGFPDASYQEQGTRLVSDRTELFASADVLLQVHPLDANPAVAQENLDLMRRDQIVLGLLNPLGAPEAAQELAERGITSFALELLPRISRAQPMDALTSMATVAGYKAVLVAAGALHKMFPLMMTAAGTLSPARVLVIGAGVAGLQAVATAHRLGAVVQAYDVRPAVKEQVESLGVKFLELELKSADAEETGGYARTMDEDFYRRQRELMTRVIAESDIVITTAAVPGKKAPMLIPEAAVQGMRPGSVILDLAADSGGNCELTQPGETIECHGVTILGPVDLPSTVPYHASQMYSGNVTAFLQNLVKDGQLKLNLEDEIIGETLLTHQGEVVNSQVRELLARPASASVSDGRSNS